MRPILTLAAAAVLVHLIAPPDTVAAGAVETPEPGPNDTCPVCGMFVAKYPEWIASVLYQDGRAHHFDGAKDLFKYLLELPKWAPGRRAADIAAMGVTEYYGLDRIDARRAWYVIGSDTLGPMGHELVPLESREDAEAFMRDHAGRRILRFEDISLELLNGLDEGRFPSRGSDPSTPP
jgi:nitrous oxide reductase accessory protein NosL